jgi:cystathionine beta-lyase/cystathionine gamma-synthase
VYTRWANPTVDAFAAAVGDLEGAAASDGFSSGMAAISSIYLALCGSGDRIVTARQLYGGTHSLFSDRLPRYGIETTFCDVDDYDAIEAALPGAKALHCETIGNPRVRMADIPRLAALARAARLPLVVDNTFASPILCRPLELGASIVMHSATKFIGGHHDLMGGVICVADPALLATIQDLARETGPTMSPFNAFLAMRGLATIHLRVQRSSESALEVARFLEGHPEIENVSYPALDSSPDKALCDSLLGGRGGGTLGFDVAGDRERASEFQARLRLIKRAASLGGTHTLVVHAASITHTQLSAEELRAAGISEGFCRLSIGLEDVDDLIADLDQALP